MTLRDVVYLAGAGFFTLFLFLLINHFVFSMIMTRLVVSEAINQSSTATAVLNQGITIFNVGMDRIAIAGFFGIFLAFIITSWFTRSFPILIPLYIIGGVVAVILAMFSSNFWEDITNSPYLVTSLAYFPFANHIMLNLPVYIAVFFVMGLIIVFAKPGEGSGDGAYG